MSRAIGGKDKRVNIPPRNPQEIDRVASASAVRDSAGRLLPGHPGLNGVGRRPAREWKLYIEEQGMQAAVDALIRAAKGEFITREQLDASREIKNTVIGKPTEKVEVDQRDVTFHAMTDEQMGELAQKVIGGEPETGPKIPSTIEQSEKVN